MRIMIGLFHADITSEHHTKQVKLDQNNYIRSRYMYSER